MNGVDLKRLQEQLLDKDQDTRAAAIIELEQRWKEIGSTKAISLLKATLYDDATSQDNRLLIIGVLARIGIETEAVAEVIPILADAMNQATESKLDTLYALARIGEEGQAQAEVIPTLIQAAEGKDAELRYYAVDALARMLHPDAIAYVSDQAQTDIGQIRHGPLHFADVVRLSDSGLGDPRIAFSGRNVYITWLESRDVYFIRSNDSGASFGSEMNLSVTSAYSGPAGIAASGNSVYVAWRDEFIRQGDVFFARSNTYGASFFQRVNLSNSPGRSSGKPFIAADGDFVYVVWFEGVDTLEMSTMFRASADRGATFGDIVNLSQGAIARKPAIAAVGQNVYMAWVGASSIVCRTSADGGATFDAPITLNSDPSGPWQPQIVAEGDNAYVVRLDSLEIPGGNEDILFAASRDRGATFEDPINLSNSEARSSWPCLDAFGNSVYVVWHEDVGGDEDILFRGSSNRGVSFEGVVNLSDNDERSIYPCISASGNYVYVAWLQGSPDGHILLRSSTESGRSFGDAIRISDHYADPGSIVGHGSNVYTAFRDVGLGILFRKGSRW